MTQDDRQFLDQFEAAALDPAEFTHRSHLRVAWLLLREEPTVERATERMIADLLRFTAKIGKQEKFHHTLTCVWIQLVAHAMKDGADSLDALLVRHPQLSDSSLPKRHYRPETLDSAEARARWVPPDLFPLETSR